ncbi:hypothetical protein H4S07_004843, partial [Coemansia furcata]
MVRQADTAPVHRRCQRKEAGPGLEEEDTVGSSAVDRLLQDMHRLGIGCRSRHIAAVEGQRSRLALYHRTGFLAEGNLYRYASASATAPSKRSAERHIALEDTRLAAERRGSCSLLGSNSNGIWDGYALPHAAAQPNAGHTPGSYKAWLDNVRPQRRDPSAYVHLPNHQMRNALGGGQDEYTTYESNEPKYTDTSVEPYTTEEVQPTYEAHPVYSTAVYKSTEPSACPAPVEPITVTVTCTVTEPAPPPVTVTFVSTATETVTITEEVEPTTQ